MHMGSFLGAAHWLLRLCPRHGAIRRLVTRGTPLGILLLATSAPSVNGAGGPGRSLTIVRERDSVRLVARFARGRYPRGALVGVETTIENHGPYPVLPRLSCSDPVKVDVLGRHGRLLFPPVFRVSPPPAVCQPSGALYIYPGSSFTWRTMVILRGPIIRASVYVDVYPQREAMTLVTPKARVRLSHGIAPRLTLHTEGPVYAVVRPAPGSTAKTFRYNAWSICPGQGLRSGEDVMPWPMVRAGDRITPGCDDPEEWHVVVGALGQPVSYIDYQRSSNRARADGVGKFTSLGASKTRA